MLDQNNVIHDEINDKCNVMSENEELFSKQKELRLKINSAKEKIQL